MADPVAEGVQNMSVQDYDTNEFDPYSAPQKMVSAPSNAGVDLLGDLTDDVSITNGHGNRHVSFDHESGFGLPDPAFVGSGQTIDPSAIRRHESTGEILGYQNEYGESIITGQKEYGGDERNEHDQNLANLGMGNMPQGGNQDYYMSTGQPLVDFGNDMQTGQPGQPQDLMGDNNIMDDISSHDPSHFQNQNFYEEQQQHGGHMDNVPGFPQAGVSSDNQLVGEPEEDFDMCSNSDPDPNSWRPEMDAERLRRSMSPERSISPTGDSMSQEAEMDPERSRRSLSPERSMSPSGRERSQEAYFSPGRSESPDALEVVVDPERMRRSKSPERSLSPQEGERSVSERSISPNHDYSQSADITSPMSADVTSPVDSYGNVDTEEMSSLSEMSQPPENSGQTRPVIPKTALSDTDSPRSARREIVKPKAGHIPRLTDSPKKQKKGFELPPWDDNVVIPKPPRVKPTLIGKQLDLPPPSPTRPKTAPANFTRKDASSDSGVEEDKISKSARKRSKRTLRCRVCGLKRDDHPEGATCWEEQVDCDLFPDCGDCDDECPPCCLALCNCFNCLLPGQRWEHKHRRVNIQNSGDSKLKRYGTDTKNDAYKPGGGNVQVFMEKVDKRPVSARTDHSKPKSGLLSPRQVKSPTPTPKSVTPKNVQSKIGSLNNVKHSPGGGNVTVMSTKVDFSTVKSKVGSKDKIDHKPKGGDKKVESRKLTWQSESKVGSLKNATHSPGGGNIKIPEPYEEELEWEADAKVNTLENIDYVPGGGKVKIFSEKLLAVAKVDTALHKRVENAPGTHDSVNSRYDCSQPQISASIEPVLFEHSNKVDVSHNAESTSLTEMEETNVVPPPKPPRNIRKQWEMEKKGKLKKNDEDEPDGENRVMSQINDTEVAIAEVYSPEVSEYTGGKLVIRHDELENMTESVDDEAGAFEVVKLITPELEQIVEEAEDLANTNDDKGDKFVPDTVDPIHERTIKMDYEVEAFKEVESEFGMESEDIVAVRTITDITNDQDNLQDKAVDYRKEIVIDEEEHGGFDKENIKSSRQTRNEVKCKKGIVGKMKSFFTSKKSDWKPKKDNDELRFASTSKSVQRTNSKLNKGVKDKSRAKMKTGHCEIEEMESTEDEMQMMVKYLGYASPKLLKKKDTECDNRTSAKNESTKTSMTKIEIKRNSSKGRESVEKVANLGYSNLKVAKKNENVCLTGAKIEHKNASGMVVVDEEEQERYQKFDKLDKITNVGCHRSILGPNRTQIEVTGYPICNDRTVPDVKDNTDFSESLNDVTNIQYKMDAANEYQELDFSREANNFGSCKFLCTQKTKPRTLNFGMVDYADADDDNEEDSDFEEREVSYAELQINQNKNAQPVQTTTFKYNSKIVRSPINEMRQVLLDVAKDGVGCLKTEDRRDESKKRLDTAQEMGVIERNNRTIQDDFGYSLVVKNKKISALYSSNDGLMDDTNDSANSDGNIEHKITEDISKQLISKEDNSTDRRYQRSTDNLDRNLSERHSKGMRHVSESKHKRSSDDLDKELTLNEELKLVLAGMQDTRNTFLRPHSKIDGTETGSHPGTPQISVKPIILMSGTGARGLGYSGSLSMGRFSSFENLLNPAEQMFNRHERGSQSMMVTNSHQGTDKAGRRPLDRGVDIGRQITAQIRPIADDGLATDGHGLDRVVNHRLAWSAQSRVGSMDNARHSPGGGKVKILDQKVEVKAHSKIGSTANIKHKPGGGDKKIETQKIDFKDSAKSKVGSMDKVKHKPGGGDIKVFNESPEWKSTSRVQSLQNVKYVPGGGDVKVISEKVNWEAASRVGSLDNVKHTPGGGTVKVVSKKLSWSATPRVESLQNVGYTPGHGDVKMVNEKLNWQVKARVQTFQNNRFRPHGGNVQILDEKVDFTETASSKVGSMDKVKHQPGGGDKKIETQKLHFKESAKPRTNTGKSSGREDRSHSESRSESVTSQDDLQG